MTAENKTVDRLARHDFSDHSLSPRYFYGYTTTKSLVSDLDRLVVQPPSSDRDEYVYYRNHHVRGWIDDGTKVIETPSVLLGKHICKIHRILEANDRISDIEIEYNLGDGGPYRTTRSIIGDNVRSLYERLQPEGTVVITRPEEFLADVLSTIVGYDDEYMSRFSKSSQKYIERIDDDGLDWDDVYEQAENGHPKFESAEEVVEKVNGQTNQQIVMAEELGGILRGYKVEINDETYTLVCRGWGRDMAHLITSELLEYPIDSVMFNGGCGALQPGFSMNDFVVPTGIAAPGEDLVNFDNTFLSDQEFTESVPHVTGKMYNANSLADETVEYMKNLAEEGYTSIGMEEYGIAKALDGTDVSFGALLYIMDLPMEGVDLGQTNYDEEMKGQVVAGNQQVTDLTFEHLGLLGDSE